MRDPQSPVQSISSHHQPSTAFILGPKPSHFPRLKNFVLAGLILSLCLFSACEWPTTKITPLREPPLIPSAPDVPTQATAPQEAHIANYADTTDIQNFSPALAQAVTRALSLSVLKPATPDSKFEPEKPICYGEFRQWANDYQNAINTAQASATAISPDSPPPAAGPLTPPPTLTAVTQTWLPSEMMWGAQGVREKTVLTRETLCALAVFLNGQDGVARKLSPSQIAKSQPGQDNTANPDDASSPDGSLSQLADYSKISPWALKYVALSYQNDWLDSVFTLSPAKVVADENFQPSQPVSRAEALLLLDKLFGSKLPNPGTTSANPSPSTTSTTPGNLNPAAIPRTQMSGTSLAPQSNPQNTGGTSAIGQPIPVGHYQSLQESGPQGSRNAIQVNGPE